MKATKLAWPVDDVSLLKGDQNNLKMLDKLVEQPKEACSTEHFGKKKSIRFIG